MGHFRGDLPLFPPNLELPQLFEPNFLEPENLKDLSIQTKIAFSALLNYQDNNYQLSLANYKNILRLLSEIEDSNDQLILKDVGMTEAQIELIDDQNRFRLYRLYLNFPDDIPPSIDEGDYVVLRKMDDNTDKVFQIRKIRALFLEIRFTEYIRSSLDTNCHYDVKFRKEQTVYRMEQHAASTIHEDVISNVLFPIKCGTEADPTEILEWLSEPVKTNPEQQQAVRNIVNGSSYPAPYILFGPPGTGKTTTLVEAIAQVWKIKSDAKILVCASSNYACNEILSRLMDLNYIPTSEMFRYLSRSQTPKMSKIDERIWDISNIDRKLDYEYPDFEELQKYKIIFATLVTAGRIALKGIGTNHFDYIFIDEAGSATEASSIIPIAGFVSCGLFSFGKRNHVILAGDPKQLGPITFYGPTEKLMYGRSLLDRLMERKLYQPNDVTKKYNPACITKLLQNFRSHKNILEIANKLFYENELLPKAHPNITNIALGADFLPNPSIPIVFHAINGFTLQDADNPSLYNEEECEIVLEYLKEVMLIVPKKEIGVISPYRRQCNEISTKIRDEFGIENIEVGSVEQFQGQERSVIILSTVRSNTPTIGFLNNPKRLNVSITRAKALLVIIGNPKTLQRDKNWYELIKYCKEHNVCAGKKFKLKEKPTKVQASKSTPPNYGSMEELCELMGNITLNDLELKIPASNEAKTFDLNIIKPLIPSDDESIMEEGELSDSSSSKLSFEISDSDSNSPFSPIIFEDEQNDNDSDIVLSTSSASSEFMSPVDGDIMLEDGQLSDSLSSIDIDCDLVSPFSPLLIESDDMETSTYIQDMSFDWHSYGFVDDM